MSLVERAVDIRAIQERLRNPPNAVDDPGVDLRRHKSLSRNGVAEFSQVLSAVCSHYDIDRETIRGGKRTQDVVLPRHVAMYLAYSMTKLSFPKIGVMMGGRDHTTILHAVNKIGEREKTDPDLAEQLTQIRRRVHRPKAKLDWSIICFDHREI